MDVKGIPINSFKEYLKQKLSSEDFYKLIDNLPKESKEIYTKNIYATEYYPLFYAILEPNRIAGELFFNGEVEKLAYESGIYSAKKAIKSIFKILVKITSLKVLVKQAKIVFNSYYSEGEAIVQEQSDEKIILLLKGHKKEEKLNIVRIAGWIHGFFETLGRKFNSVNYKINELENGNVEGIIEIFFEK
jgi:hypothetical protein